MNREARQLCNRLSSFAFPASEYLDQTGYPHRLTPRTAGPGVQLAPHLRPTPIEKDFQTIKSVIKLRPIYSYTDPKVQAHVTLCMLALLLCRSLEHQLKQANLALSAAACLETLATCHLNRLRQRLGGRAVYSVTEATKVQREILHALGLGDLTDDQAVTTALNL